MIYLLTAVWLSPGGSTRLHTNNTQNNTNNNRTTQITTNVEECEPCPVFASFTLAFALQLRKNHGQTSVRVRKNSVRLRKTSVRVEKNFSQSKCHKDYVNEKFQLHHRDSNPPPSGLQRSASTNSATSMRRSQFDARSININFLVDNLPTEQYCVRILGLQ